jgi:hypothetical protein
LGVTAATRGKTVFNDGNGAFYGVRSEKSGDVDSDDTVFLNNGNVAERIKSMNIIAKGNNIIFVANVAELIDSDALIGNVYGTTGYYSANDGGAGLYSIRTKIQSDVEDGGSIIFLDNGNVAECIDLNIPRTFDVVADLKNASLFVGLKVSTKGYYSVNDGGSALYTIRAKDVADVDDGGSIIFLDNGNVAELITDGTVCPEQFGAVGDGTTDDTTAITNALAFSPNGVIGKKNYHVTSIALTGWQRLDLYKVSADNGITINGNFNELNIYELRSNGDYGVKLYSNANSSGTAHNNCNIKRMIAKGTANSIGYYIYTSGNGYVNENFFSECDMHGSYAIKLENNSSAMMNRNMFRDFDLETSDKGIWLCGTVGYVEFNSFKDFRTIEGPRTNYIIFEGNVINNVFYFDSGFRLSYITDNGFTCAALSSNMIYGKVLTNSGTFMWDKTKVFNNGGIAFAKGDIETRLYTVTKHITIDPTEDTNLNFNQYTYYLASVYTEKTITLSKAYILNGYGEIKLIAVKGMWTPRVVDADNNMIYSENAVSTEDKMIKIIFSNNYYIIEKSDVSLISMGA